MNIDPIRPVDDAARAMAGDLLARMRHAFLAVFDPETGFPHLSRIACQQDEEGCPTALLSGLALHSRALATDPRAGLLIDSARQKGDPMTWPRLSLQVRASRRHPDPALRVRWLERHPRAAVFVDLPDFAFWRLVPERAFLNAGFGAAYRLTSADLGM